MLVAVHAVGRMKAGPEQELAARYLDRFAKSGPAVGLEFSGVLDIAEGRAQSADERRRDEAARLRAQLAKGAALIVLDERGKNLGSADLAQRIGDLRDGGRRGLAFVDRRAGRARSAPCAARRSWCFPSVCSPGRISWCG